MDSMFSLFNGFACMTWSSPDTTAQRYAAVPHQDVQPTASTSSTAPHDVDVELMQLRANVRDLQKKNAQLENNNKYLREKGAALEMRSDRACGDLEDAWSARVALLQAKVDHLSKEAPTQDEWIAKLALLQAKVDDQAATISHMATELRVARITNVLHQRKHFAAQRSQHMLQTAYDGQVASGKDMLQHIASLKAQLIAQADASTAALEQLNEKMAAVAVAINNGVSSSTDSLQSSDSSAVETSISSLAGSSCTTIKVQVADMSMDTAAASGAASPFSNSYSPCTDQAGAILSTSASLCTDSRNSASDCDSGYVSSSGSSPRISDGGMLTDKDSTFEMAGYAKALTNNELSACHEPAMPVYVGEFA